MNPHFNFLVFNLNSWDDENQMLMIQIMQLGCNMEACRLYVAIKWGLIVFVFFSHCHCHCLCIFVGRVMSPHHSDSDYAAALQYGGLLTLCCYQMGAHLVVNRTIASATFDLIIIGIVAVVVMVMIIMVVVVMMKGRENYFKWHIPFLNICICGKMWMQIFGKCWTIEFVEILQFFRLYRSATGFVMTGDKMLPEIWKRFGWMGNP